MLPESLQLERKKSNMRRSFFFEIIEKNEENVFERYYLSFIFLRTQIEQVFFFYSAEWFEKTLLVYLKYLFNSLDNCDILFVKIAKW